jgi:hypothetical protein
MGVAVKPMNESFVKASRRLLAKPWTSRGAENTEAALTESGNWL